MGIYLQRNYLAVYVYPYQIGNSIISSFHSLPGTRSLPYIWNMRYMDNFRFPICDFRISIFCSCTGIRPSLYLRTWISQVIFALPLPKVTPLSFYPSFSIFLLVSLSLLWFSLSPASFPFIFYIYTSLFIFKYYILWIFYPFLCTSTIGAKKIEASLIFLLQFTNSKSNFIRILVFSLILGIVQFLI